MRSSIPKPAAVGRLFSALPAAWLSGILWSAQSPLLSGRPPFSLACALAARSAFLRRRSQLIDHVLTPTRLMERLLSSNGIQPKSISFSRFGIDLDHFRPAAASRGRGEVLRIGFIGSLAHPKGPHVLIEALRRTPAALPVELRIYGNPAVYPRYAAELQRLAGPDPRVCFCGTFPNSVIGDVFADLDVFVVPSLWYENTPLVIYSAQAANCPILASDLEGMAEVIRDGVDGLLFPAGDSAALAAFIERLCNDRTLVRALSANAPRPKSVAEYTDEIVRVYLGLLGSEETSP